jgi:hypothetical protein
MAKLVQGQVRKSDILFKDGGIATPLRIALPQEQFIISHPQELVG